jgi:hypothetical protein
MFVSYRKDTFVPRKNRTSDSKPCPTSEATGYVNGLYSEFHQQVERYHSLTQHLLEMEARVELAEKQLCLTRDHLAMVVKSTDCAAPRDWRKAFESVRFVGYRLVDACTELLQENKKMTSNALLDALNHRMFRFRTSAPFREIHAAMLRQTSVKRTDDVWEWIGTAPEQERFRLVRRTESSGTRG